MTRMIWQCNDCMDIVVSYSHLRHDMNWCECKKSSIDLEEDYCRGVGSITTLSVKEKISGEWRPVE